MEPRELPSISVGDRLTSFVGILAAVLSVAAVFVTLSLGWKVSIALVGAILLMIGFLYQKASLAAAKSRQVEDLDHMLRGLRNDLDTAQAEKTESKENEERYRLLFEDAMETAYQDVEKMNRSLQEQKDTLEREVHKHEATERALRDSEERWRKLVEKHPEPIAILSDKKFVYTNAAGMDLLGVYNKKDLASRTLLDFVPEGMRERVEGKILHAKADGGIDPVQFEILQKDGSERIVEAYSVPISYKGSKAMQVVIRDITDQKRSESALRKYTDRLAVVNDIESKILASLPSDEIAREALVKLSRLIPLSSGSVVEYNLVTGEAKLLAQLTTSPSQNRVGQSYPISRFGSLYSSEKTKYVPELAQLEDPTPGEREMLDDGMQSYFDIPLVGKAEVIGRLQIASINPDGFDKDDIQTAEGLADLIGVSIQQFRIDKERRSYEAELINAKERAEELVRLKSAFLTNMSHEIRTPLTGIIGFAQILNEEIGEQHSEFVQLIENSGRRLLDTINSVLDLARLESQKMRTEKVRTDLVDEVTKTVKLIEPLAMKKNLKLVSQAHVKEAFALVDPAGLGRIITNLVGNAIKFTEEGGVRVDIAKKGGRILIRVRDTGIGIAKEFLPRLFDEFQQESSGAARSHEGSGMGLSITRKLVELMGGTITVKSKKGVGSAFIVAFPEEGHAPLTTVREDNIIARRRNLVLLIEDRQESRELYNYLLEDSCDVLPVGSRRQAIKLLEREPVDAVVLQVNYGGKGMGKELIPALRKALGTRDVPIIAVDNRSTSDEKVDWFADGYSSYISRPYQRTSLGHGVREAIKSAKARRNKTRPAIARNSKASPATTE